MAHDGDFLKRAKWQVIRLSILLCVQYIFLINWLSLAPHFLLYDGCTGHCIRWKRGKLYFFNCSAMWTKTVNQTFWQLCLSSALPFVFFYFPRLKVKLWKFYCCPRVDIVQGYKSKDTNLSREDRTDYSKYLGRQTFIRHHKYRPYSKYSYV